MGKIIYLITTSLDGYAADAHGSFDWATPSEEVHAFVNEQLRDVGTILMGHRLYDTMKIWEKIPTEGMGGPMDGPSKAMNDYAKIWHAARKIVYSTSLTEVEISNATIERSFDPIVVQQMAANSDSDIDIGGPTLAGQVLNAGIIDEYHHLIAPVLIGNGLSGVPHEVHAEFDLVGVHEFENGFVHLEYRKMP